MIVPYTNNNIQLNWCDSRYDVHYYTHPSDIKEYITKPELNYIFVTKWEKSLCLE